MSFKFMPADPPPLGGILADEMGMGKTIQILGLVDLVHEDMKGLPRDEFTSATLIVCTASVLDHWQSEISKHFKTGTFTVCRYHGPNKPADPRAIARNKLVLTTYDTLANEYATQSAGQKLNADDEPWKSPLLEVKWRRVILDEAHGVRDLNTKKSAAVFALDSERRWCITGTPVQNSLQDLYCLIKFLHVPIFTELKWWNDLVTIPFMHKDNSALTRLFDIIQPIMMRRLKSQKSSVDGQELMKLPELRKEVEFLEMSEEETKFYDYLFKESKTEFERMCHLGVAMRNYRKIIELINKVRLACCHPYLAIGSIYQKGLDAQLFYDALHSEEMKISYMKTTTEQIEQIQKLKCPGCRMEMYELQELECGHTLCLPCCKSLQIWNDEDTLFTSKKPKDADSVVVCRECRAASAWPRIKKMDRGIAPPNAAQDYLDSTKTKAVITDIKSHNEKAVVFSQYVKFLDILQAGLDRESILHLRIDGSMTPGKRNKVIEDFRAGPARVLFVSIRSGNAGIDLQIASRAYIMEPWWNPGVEEQAMHRVHRMGQTKEVVVKRYFIKGTVEARMLKLQEGKLYLSRFADQDKESLTKNYKLEELKALFDDARLDMKGEIARRNGQTAERNWLETANEEMERENDFNRRSLGAGAIRKRRGATFDDTDTDPPGTEDPYGYLSQLFAVKPDPYFSGGSGEDSESPSKRAKFD